MLSRLQHSISGTVGAVTSAVSAGVNVAGTVGGNAVHAAESAVAATARGIQTVANTTVNAAESAVAATARGIQTAGSATVNAATTAANAVQHAEVATARSLQAAASATVNATESAVETARRGIQTAAAATQSAANTAVSVVHDAEVATARGIQTAASATVNAANTAASAVHDAEVATARGIQTAASATVNAAESAVAATRQGIQTAASATVSAARTAVAAVDSGIQTAANAMGTAVNSAAQGVGRATVNTLADVVSGGENLMHQGGQAARALFGDNAVNSAVSGLERVAQGVGATALPVLGAELAGAPGAALGEKLTQQFDLAPRGDGGNDGRFVGANNQTFPPGTPLTAPGMGVNPTARPGQPPPTSTTLFVNGIDNSAADQGATMQAIADHQNTRVVGIHNATNGVIGDVAQSAADIAGVGNNPAVNTLSNAIYDQLKQGQPVNIVAHSQGALVTSRAIDDTKQRLMSEGMSQQEAEQQLSHVNVQTYGGAAPSYPDGPNYTHFVHQVDPVGTPLGMGNSDNQVNGGRNSRLVTVPGTFEHGMDTYIPYMPQ